MSEKKYTGKKYTEKKKTKKKKHRKKEPVILNGTFTANARGFGFVSVDGEEEDVFIPPSETHGAMQDDVVEISVVPSDRGKREGSVKRIISHGVTQVVGTYQKSKNYGFVVPDNARIQKDLFIPKGNSMHARQGEKVVAVITSYAEEERNPEGQVTECLGMPDDVGVDVLSIIRDYEIPETFSPRVLRQAQRIPQQISEADMAGRTDLRDLLTVTIDGEDARDLDDAITLQKDGEDYLLGVHIADVSNYVQENSALDREALRRGTSVYPVDRVIPMLPTELSNGICSLNQGEDRLTLSCLMRLNQKGEITDHRITESVICVDRRMTYTDVNRIITFHDEDTAEKYRECVPMFLMMKELSDKIRAARRERGAIDFDFPETKVILDENGRVTDLKPYDRNAATRLIEDFMLAANETVAEEYFWRQLPFLYRVHETPDKKKIAVLSTLIEKFGFSFHGTSHEIHPKELQKLLSQVRNSPEENLIARLVLRSMKQAKYSPECTGHFGLAARYYCHFTSPIRRYPDLQIHRIIKDTLRGRMNQEKSAHYSSILPSVAEQTSRLERRSDEVERETVKLKKVEYMENHLGEMYPGVISGVTNYGFYVELPNTVEGLVHVSTLQDDYYDYYEESFQLVGEHTGRVFTLGQKVSVIVTNADRISRTIDFILAYDGDLQEILDKDQNGIAEEHPREQ